MRGTFGSTTLFSYLIAGRVTMSFQRGDNSVTYIAEDGDPLGISARLKSCHVALVEALSMFNEVIDRWPADAPEQQVVFVGDREARIL